MTTRQSRSTPMIYHRRSDLPDLDALLRDLFVRTADRRPGGRKSLPHSLRIRANKAASDVYTPRLGDVMEMAETGANVTELAAYLRNVADMLEDVSVDLPAPTFGALALEMGEGLAAGAKAATEPCPTVDAAALKELGEVVVTAKAFMRVIGARRFQQAPATRQTALGTMRVVR